MATKTKKNHSRAHNAAPKVTTSPRRAAKADKSKKDAVLRLLRRQNGASIAEIAAETDWLPHSVRGFLTATVRKKLELPLVTTKANGSNRRYHIAALKPAKE